MLKQVYVDNYLCLVNFEIHFDRLNLLLGGNGTGKTTVFQVVQALQSFITAGEKIGALFPAATLTRWQTTPVQRFGFSIQHGSDTFAYGLKIEHDRHGRVHVVEEKVLLDDRPLFLFEKGHVQLFQDDYGKGPAFPFDWHLSGLNTVTERHDNANLTRFKQAVARWVVVQLEPRSMSATCTGEDSRLSSDGRNFVAWLRFLSQEHQDLYLELVNQLKETMPGFVSFRFVTVGEDVKSLRLLFGDRKLEYRFNELSDGQRSLIALETLLFCLQNTTLLIDEPENFLALPEIQPWISSLQDRCDEEKFQAVIISHHPEYIDFIAADHGIWFEREQNAPARVRRLQSEGNTGVGMSELVARGWLRE
ncbi:MAG: AAA family ATPase [Acidobacteriota bacterium]|nr:AAA family ATPase [Acidobacteriota bacterium]